MRALLLFLSHRRGLRRWMETSRLARRVARRFVAGETLADALDVGRCVNAEGISLTLDHLGENVTSLEEAAASSDVYAGALDGMCEAGIEGNVSLKLTQFGMDLSEAECRANVERVVKKAAGLSSFVRVDMESSEYAERTLDLVCDLHATYAAVGTVIQAYLYRSERDVEMLCERSVRVRLCKGAYLEPESVAFPRKPDVDANYVRLMKVLLDRGAYPAIATHDAKIIETAKTYAAGRGIGRERFEFQMLYGIRRDLQRRLVAEGYRLRLYLPFGKAWYPYFMRRLAERPANVVFLARNLLRR